MKRKLHYDYLRVIAMFAVILAHVANTANIYYGDTVSIELNGLFHIFRNITRFAVPIFFMISGSLLLVPEKQIDIKTLFKKYIFKYAVVLVIFSWLYAYISFYYEAKEFILEDVYYSFIGMLENDTWAHMWYLYGLIGVMLILPATKIITRYASKQELKYLILVLMTFVSIMPFFESIITIDFGIRFPLKNSYLLYFMIGYYISYYHKKFPNWMKYTTLILTLSSIALASYYTIVYEIDLEWVYEYSSPLIVGLSSIIYSWVIEVYETKQDVFKNNEFINLCAKHSFGIYIVHLFWIDNLFRFIKYNPFYPHWIIGIIVSMIFTFITSYMTVYIMKKIPVLKTYI